MASDDNRSSGEESPEGVSPKPGFGKQQVIALIITLVVLVIVFAQVLPQLGDYDQAWAAIQDMPTEWLVALLVATIAVILIYVLPYMAALPGLKFGQGFVVRQTSFMVSNAIPAGGAIGIGVQYSMMTGYGHGPAPTTAVIGITSTWNSFVTLSLPILALAGLALSGQANVEASTAAVIGLLLVVAAIVVFVLVLRKEETARRVGDWGGRAITGAARLIRKEIDIDAGQGVVDFRNSIVGVVLDRWLIITVANLGQQLAQFGVLWIALVAVQGGSSEVALIEAFAAFAFARLLTFIPVPPGGLGTLDAALTAMLQGFGVPNDLALAAVLIWRAATYFPQIFIGIGTFLYWRHQDGKRRETAAVA